MAQFVSNIADNITQLRKANKMSMEELGIKVGVSKQTIQRYESKEIKNIPYDKIMLIASALGVTPIELMGWSDEKPVQRNLSAAVASEDFELLTKYAQLIKEDKKIIMDMINSLLKKEQLTN